jgi:hypothetical protein
VLLVVSVCCVVENRMRTRPSKIFVVVTLGAAHAFPRITTKMLL